MCIIMNNRMIIDMCIKSSIGIGLGSGTGISTRTSMSNNTITSMINASIITSR